MKSNPSLFISLMLVFCLKLSGTEIPNPSIAPGSVTGMIQDSASGLPVEYANITIYSLPDSIMVNGCIINSEVKFV